MSEIKEDESDGEDVRGDVCDGDLTSDACSDAQSLDSRSCGESVSKREVQGELERDLLNTLVSEFVEGNVNAKIIDSSKDSGSSKITNEDIGTIPDREKGISYDNHDLSRLKWFTYVHDVILEKAYARWDGSSFSLGSCASTSLVHAVNRVGLIKSLAYSQLSGRRSNKIWNSGFEG
ncbi:hypothetical protein Tco_1032036 [Tanacetum coccineum]|uniref:Uncharacterized protein n=1 Tax=Tanacetum coccineum TaxID=301880 RepID=A0ABQ5GC61_9ASTR